MSAPMSPRSRILNTPWLSLLPGVQKAPNPWRGEVTGVLDSGEVEQVPFSNSWQDLPAKEGGGIPTEKEK
jgi:hypothetical protein